MILSEHYHKTRAATMEIVGPLNIEDYIPQPIYFVSPARWVLGHTTWFFEEMVLKKYQTNYKEYNSNFNFLFNSYYNTLGDRTDRKSRGDLSRPTVEEVKKYRYYVDDHINTLLSDTELNSELESTVMIGINHEQQHQELLFTDIKYTLGVNPLFPAYSNKALVENNNEDVHESFIMVDEGLNNIGFDGDGFCFDNELPVHKVFLQKFEISRQLVTNGEFIEFIEDGGYNRFEFWHDEALSWKRDNNITQPMYWEIRDRKWYQFTLAGLRELNPDNILAHVNYYEAWAFASWKGMRLPTEFEWEVASEHFSWGKRWEWTESAYLPYPGFQIPEGALGEYNGKFMINQMVLRGGSVATPENHERKTYRNFFHPQMGHQFNGIRLVRR